MRILAASPVHQQPETLSLFLESLERLQVDNHTLDFLFIDDNDQEAACLLLELFTEKHPEQTLPAIQGTKKTAARTDEYTHYWPSKLVWKVAGYKNALIAAALQLDYDALFLIDSDLLLHPAVLSRLVNTGKDIVSEIFWTRWQPGSRLLPQVWMSDNYNLYENKNGEALTEEQQRTAETEFLDKLSEPGLYEVGGLGACTLIRRSVLEAGVHFGRIPNVTFWGEDRHFCIRAAAMGFSLYVDTHYPAFHLYRESDRDKGKLFLARTAPSSGSGGAPIATVATVSSIYSPISDPAAADISLPESLRQHGFPGIRRQRPKLTLTMTVCNEADRKLGDVLRSCREFIDEAVIIDDGSQDGSGELCRDLLQGIPLRLIRNESPSFANEAALRQQQWQETAAVSPEWILNLDADEIFEDRFAQAVHPLIAATSRDVICFRLYDMWSETHYRSDSYWQSHQYYRPFLVRYRPDYPYRWKEQVLHCGRFPDNLLEQPFDLSEYRIKHWGWFTPGIRQMKHERYLRLDPQARYGWKEQYDSILDPNPTLIAWDESI